MKSSSVWVVMTTRNKLLGSGGFVELNVLVMIYRHDRHNGFLLLLWGRYDGG